MVRVDRRKANAPPHAEGPPPSAADQRALNSEIARAADRASINQLVLLHSSTFNSVNCATALHRLAKCAPAATTQAATDAHWKKSWTLAAKATSAKATSTDEDAEVEALLCGRCATVLGAGSEEVSARSLTSIAWATAKLKLGHAQLRTALTSQASLQVAHGGLDAFGIANVAWALATLSSAERAESTDAAGGLLDALAEAAAPTIDGFKPQELCNLLWAFTTLRRPHAALFDAAAISAEARIDGFSAQGLSQTLWSFAKLGLKKPSLFLAAAKAALPRLRTYDAQSVSTLAWSFGAAELEHPELLAGLSAEVLARPTAFDASSCARLLDALSRLTEGVDPKAVAALSTRLTHVAGESLQSKPLLHALSALATFKSGGGGGGGGAALATLLCEAACKAAPILPASKLGITAWALSRPSVLALLPATARASWKAALRGATLRVADDLSWRCVGHVEVALRVLDGSFDDGAPDPVAMALSEAARRSTDLSNGKSAMRNEAPTRLLHKFLFGTASARHGLLTASLPGVRVLVVGFEEGGATALLDEKLLAAGLTPVHWRRFASSRRDAEARAWPRKAGKAGAYVACLVRWSWYAAGDAASMMIHAVSSVTQAGTPLWLCGNEAEGVAAAADLLAQSYGGSTRLLVEDGCHLYTAERGAAGAAAVESAKGSLSGWATQSTLVLPQAVSGSGRKRAKPEAASDGGGNRKARKRAASRLRQGPEPPEAPPVELPWETYPGLFAGGGLDVMTTALLSTLPTPPAGARVLDACCGSGTIAAALRHAPDGEALRLHLLDADAVATHAAAVNVADAERHFLCASWPHTPSAFSSTGKPKRYDWIVSNPPVHRGQPDDFRVVEELIRGARKRLKRDGVLWIVAQEQVPIGRLLALHGTFASVKADICRPDGRFVVWSGRGRAKKRGTKRKRGKS